MNRILPLADRAALLGLKLLAGLNVLVFVGALGVAVSAASHVRAGPAPNAMVSAD